MITIEVLVEIQKRLEKATPGPWIMAMKDPNNAYPGYGILLENDFIHGDDEDNMIFISHAREDVSALLNELVNEWPYHHSSALDEIRELKNIIEREKQEKEYYRRKSEYLKTQIWGYVDNDDWDDDEAIL